MTESDLIAFGAAFVAALSALYSRWSAKAAERANDIAVHNERLRIYKGVLRFRAVLITRGTGFPDESLWELADLVVLAEFYFSRQAYEGLQKLLNDGGQIKARHDHWRSTVDGGGNGREGARALHELFRETRAHCDTVLEMLKPDLRLSRSRELWLTKLSKRRTKQKGQCES